MSDDLVLAKLEDVLGNTEKITEYFSSIGKPVDFLEKEGIKTFDAISMRLQVIGELLKTVQKTGILEKYSEIEWSEIIKLRELISHHYDKLEYDIIFHICKDSIPELRKTLARIIADLKK